MRPSGTAIVRVEPHAPFSLALTVAALRRLPSNRVDRWFDDGTYARALTTPAGPRIVSVRSRGSMLDVTTDRHAADRVVATVRRMLGTDVRLEPFYRRARSIPPLAPLARRMRGVKPPRYPTLWEALVNAVVFQQMSLAACATVMARFVERFGTRVPFRDDALHAFPMPERVREASPAMLRALGMSAAKASALRSIASEIERGDLEESRLESLESARIAERLLALDGIGPWSAALVLLRGFGRLEVFPAGDTGAARGLASLFPSARDADRALERLEDCRGMLYFHLLLARLERDDLLP